MKKGKQRKKWGLIIFLVFIMIGTSFSFVFFGFSGVSEKVRHNGFKFTYLPSQRIWMASINDRSTAFAFLPEEVMDINMTSGIGERMRDRLEIDATYDFNSTFKESIALAFHQLSLTLNEHEVYLRQGATSNNSFKLPIIDCSHASQSVPVVYFRQSNSTGINLEGNCIIANAASNSDVIKAKDRLVYEYFGIIK